MAVAVVHAKVSTIPDSDDTSLIRPSDWNATHTVTGLGTLADQNANAVDITGGTVSGLTSIGASISAVAINANLATLHNTATDGNPSTNLRMMHRSLDSYFRARSTAGTQATMQHEFYVGTGPTLRLTIHDTGVTIAGTNTASGNATANAFLTTGIGVGYANPSNLKFISTGIINWTSVTSLGGGLDVGIARNVAGVLEVNSGVAATFRDLKLRNLTADGQVNHKSYTIATLPSAATAGGEIYVSNEIGGATLAFSDGTNWRRHADRAIAA